MFDQNSHSTDEELIILADGETSKSTALKTRIHCSECSSCQARRLQIEQALSEFADLYSATVNPRLPKSSSAYSAELRDRLTAASRESSILRSARFPRFTQQNPYRFIAVAVFVVAVIGLLWTTISFRGQSLTVQQAIRLLPDNTLTPGATRTVSLTESCSQQGEDLDPSVSTSVKEIVFQKYGLKAVKSADYQIDYLINPQLGGTNDVRNLWPEPYRSTVWNAHAKDALEERLHRMVCDKQIDLTSAQRELASNWIAAYKKHFHTEIPS